MASENSALTQDTVKQILNELVDGNMRLASRKFTNMAKELAA